MKNNAKTTYNGGLYFFAMFCVYVLFAFIGQSITASVFTFGSRAYNLIVSLFPIIALVCITVYAKIKQQKTFKCLLLLNQFKPINLLLAIMLAVGMFLGLGFINQIIINGLESVGLTLPQTTVVVKDTGDFIGYALTLCLLPAVFEELFFRGVLLNDIKEYNPLHVSLFIGGLFALYHGSLSQLVYQFIYGTLLTFLAIKSGSSLPCIIAHFLNNFTIILLEYLGVYLNLLNPVVIVVGLIVLGVFLTVLIKGYNKQNRQSLPRKHYANLYSVTGAILCLSLIILGLFS